MTMRGLRRSTTGMKIREDKVVVKISMKEVAKPGGSGLTGTDRLFDSDDEEDDTELQEQIEAAYVTADTIDELKLSETSSSSGSESSDSDDDNADPNVTREYPEEQDVEGVEKPGSRPDGSGRTLLLTLQPFRQIPAIPGARIRTSCPSRILQRPRVPKERVPTARIPGRLLPPSCNFRPLPREYGNAHKQHSLGELHWHRPWGRKKTLLAFGELHRPA